LYEIIAKFFLITVFIVGKLIMSSKRDQNSWSLSTKITTAAVVVGAVVAIREFFVEKSQLENDFEQNEKECDNCYEEAENLRPEKGDMIEIKRKNYAHWVLYVGAGYVIHLVVKRGGKARVMKEKLLDIAMGSLCRVNNLLKAAQRLNLRARGISDIIWTAEQYLGNTLRYHLFDENCEHFVTLCRYGTAFSEQGLAANKKPFIKNIVPHAANGSYDIASSSMKPVRQ
jgi:hypothetical protein